MEKTYFNYKNQKYELDSYRLQTRLVNNQEVRMIHVEFRGKSFEAKDLPKIRSWLEKIIEGGLK